MSIFITSNLKLISILEFFVALLFQNYKYNVLIYYHIEIAQSSFVSQNHIRFLNLVHICVL